MNAVRRRWLPILATGAAVIVLFAGGRELAGVIPGLVRHVESLGTVGLVLFVVGYAIATVAFVPGSLLTMAAGAVFGIFKGTLLVFLGATIGETTAFLIARTVGRDAVARRVRRDARFLVIDRAIAAQGKKIVLLLRLSPVFPFNLLNYTLGLTSISLRDYVIASIGILPGTLLYVYTGKVAGDLSAIIAGVGPLRGPGYYVVLTIGLAATIAVTVVIARIARRALREHGAVSG